MPQKIKVGPNFQPPEMVLTGDRANMAQHHQPGLGEQNTSPLRHRHQLQRGKNPKAKDLRTRSGFYITLGLCLSCL